jgi:hypothetical protein
MTIYEKMWNELKNRVAINISQNIPVVDLITFMNNFEEHYKDDIINEAMVEQEKENKK